MRASAFSEPYGPSPGESFVGNFTSQGRDEWAAARGAIKGFSPVNKATLFEVGLCMHRGRCSCFSSSTSSRRSSETFRRKPVFVLGLARFLRIHSRCFCMGWLRSAIVEGSRPTNITIKKKESATWKEHRLTHVCVVVSRGFCAFLTVRAQCRGHEECANRGRSKEPTFNCS